MVKCIVAGEMPQIKLQCISIPDKGRGMVSSCVISPGSLVHSEEPYAMVTNNYILCILSLNLLLSPIIVMLMASFFLDSAQSVFLINFFG